MCCVAAVRAGRRAEAFCGRFPAHTQLLMMQPPARRAAVYEDSTGTSCRVRAWTTTRVTAKATAAKTTASWNALEMPWARTWSAQPPWGGRCCGQVQVGPARASSAMTLVWPRTGGLARSRACPLRRCPIAHVP